MFGIWAAYFLEERVFGGMLFSECYSIIVDFTSLCVTYSTRIITCKVSFYARMHDRLYAIR